MKILLVFGTFAYIARDIWSYKRYKVRYEGEYMIIETRDGTLIYKGEHKNGKRHGKGKAEEKDYRYAGDFFEN